MSRTYEWTRFVAVSVVILVTIVLHELYSESIFSAAPILATEIGWWLVGTSIIAYVIWIERKTLASIGIGKISVSTISTTMVGFLLGLMGVAMFGLITFTTGLGGESTEARLQETANAPIWWLCLLFVRAGVVEELFFRGFLISRLLDFGVTRWGALLISTAMFVLPHALFWPGPSLILVAFSGLAFAIIFIWKRDLWACVLAHIGINLGGVIAASLA